MGRGDGSSEVKTAPKMRGGSGGGPGGQPPKKPKMKHHDGDAPGIKVLLIERTDDRILERTKKAAIFQKQGTIQARQVNAGEKIETVLEDGRVETTNVSNDGDWVVTNPGGEQYIVPGEKFGDKYEATEKDGVFKAKGHVRAITNPFGEAISLEASWGELQHGADNCMIVQSCDADGNTSSDPYIIDLEAFNETYAPKDALEREEAERARKERVAKIMVNEAKRDEKRRAEEEAQRQDHLNQLQKRVDQAIERNGGISGAIDEISKRSEETMSAVTQERKDLEKNIKDIYDMRGRYQVDSNLAEDSKVHYEKEGQNIEEVNEILKRSENPLQKRRAKKLLEQIEDRRLFYEKQMYPYIDDEYRNWLKQHGIINLG